MHSDITSWLFQNIISVQQFISLEYKMEDLSNDVENLNLSSSCDDESSEEEGKIWIIALI